MTRYSIEPKTKYVKAFTRKYKKQILDKGLDPSKKVVHKAGELIGNKIADTVIKPNDDNIENKKLLKK